MNSTTGGASPHSVTNHWSAKYLGRPWVSGTSGPYSFDCWGLLWAYYRDHHGVELSRYPGIEECGEEAAQKYFDQEAHNPEWTRIQTPEEGCAVAIGYGGRPPHHVGIYTAVDGGLIVHTRKRTGVIAQSVASLARSGLSNIQFYRHARARN